MQDLRNFAVPGSQGARNGAAHAWGRDVLPPQAANLPSRQGEHATTAGLPQSFLVELALRHFTRQGEMKLARAAQLLGLGVPLVGALLQHMRELSLLEVPRRGQLDGDMSYAMTDAGQRQAQLAFEKCHYTGPAPVALADYIAQVKAQGRSQATVQAEVLVRAMQGMVVDAALLPTLGAALNSGKAIYLYGGSGVGKTMLAEHMVKTLEGHIWIPHAIYVDGEVIQVFDPIVHRPVADGGQAQALLDGEAELEPSLERGTAADGRWVRAHRPVVIAGGELTLETLDLAYDGHTRVHVAPPQMKANNGIFVVDDLGRQRVSAHALMDRWIVPLDRHLDYLRLQTGAKFAVPFDVRVVFSSNMSPEELVDAAFARRLGYKLHLQPMAEAHYRAVVAQACARTGVPTDAQGIDHLVHGLHVRSGQPFMPCVPFDVISKIADRARYLGQPPRMTPELLDWAWHAYFGHDGSLTRGE